MTAHPVPPKKPEHYWPIYSVIVTLSLLIGYVLIYFEMAFASSLTILLVIYAPQMWFRQYTSEYNEYLRKLYGLKRIEEKPSGPRLAESTEFNKNIRRYQELQRVKKENAKWWQFWR
jgi:Ca2+-dependent lipid-binding protein